MAIQKVIEECLVANFTCTDAIPTCHNSARFDFPTLWNITIRYAGQCPGGPWLFRPPGMVGAIPHEELALTDEVCKAIAGAEWKRYPGADIWARLTTWKFPLFQLVANSPRPPLGFWIEAFTFVHFFGDPIDTIANILRKIDSCQNRAKFWQDYLESEFTCVHEPERKRLWKAFAIIADSFDEWGSGEGDRAQRFLLAQLRLLSPSKNPSHPDCDCHKKFIETSLQTADALAADRSTKFVPVAIAQAFFISSVAIAMIRTKSTGSGPNPISFISIEMYSIAFTAQYFWVIFVVLWTSVIGVSQTANAIPRILKRFRNDLKSELPHHHTEQQLPIQILLNDNRRIYYGGVYSWQPARKWQPAAFDGPNKHSTGRLSIRFPLYILREMWCRILHHRLWIRFILPFVIVASAASTGQAISSLVPPVGWSCRSRWMIGMFATWMVSYIVSIFIVSFVKKKTLLFWITFVKDFLAIVATFGIIIATQVGIMNRCDCYTHNGSVGLQLPLMPTVQTLLQTRLSGAFATTVAVGIAIQLVVFPSILLWRYFDAVQVFLQRDDGTSNLDWLRALLKFCRDIPSKMSRPATSHQQQKLITQGEGGKEDDEVSLEEIEQA